MKEVETLLKQGYIVFMKNGKIQTSEPPQYGRVEITYQDGQPMYIDHYTKKKLSDN